MKVDPLSPERVAERRAFVIDFISTALFTHPFAGARRSFMSVRNKFLILLGVLLLIAALYYVFSTPGGNDLVLVGTVDSNQIVVSPQVGGRIAKLLVEEARRQAGRLDRTPGPAELEAQERAAAATISSLRSRLRRANTPSVPPRDRLRAT